MDKLFSNNQNEKLDTNETILQKDDEEERLAATLVESKAHNEEED